MEASTNHMVHEINGTTYFIKTQYSEKEEDVLDKIGRLITEDIMGNLTH